MKGDTEITNSQDIIDSRDVVDRIDYLEGFLIDEEDREDEVDGPVYVERGGELFELTEDEVDELFALRALADEASGYSPDWRYGSALIRDSYFEDYAEATANDLGMVDSKAGWPATCIDWEEAAEQLKMDYTAGDFDGVEYWIR